MRLLKATIPANCDLALTSDFHLGSRSHSDEGRDKLIAWLREDRKHRRWAFLGDAVEAIRTDDPRYDLESSEDPLPLRQCDSAVALFKPVSHQCVVWMSGNHEYALARFGDLAAHMAGQLEIPYGGYQCKVLLLAKKLPVCKMHLWHGPRSGRLESRAKDYQQRLANMAASLRRHLEAKASDCLIHACGHTHKLIVVPPCPRLLMSDDGHRLQQAYLRQGDGDAIYIEPDCRWYVNTGSYMRTQTIGHESYAEVWGLDPVELGHAVVEIRSGRVQSVRREVWCD